ncbi:cytochrome c biogenesis protein CcmG, thiol:disulfide interchange protein DsbE [Gammaproteobacteria bacterium]
MLLVSLGSGSIFPSSNEDPSIADSPRLEFRLPDLDHRERTLDEFKGRVLLVNFWGSWCAPCLEEIPSLQRLAERLQGKAFQIVAINVAEDELLVRAVGQRLHINFPVLRDWDSTVFKRWGGTMLPITYLLDGQGMIRDRILGPLEWDSREIVERLESLITASSTP